MSIEVVTLLLFGGLIVLLILGVPVAFAFGGITVLLTYVLEGSNTLFIVATTTYKQITDPNLITIPLFLLMGNFLLHSGISDRMFKSLGYWISGIRGGLAIVSIGVCVALAMCGGFGPGILTMGLIAVPAMLSQSYDKSLALGSVMAGGVLGTIIPPSIIMIIFAYIARISIGKLFLAGFVPGLITASLYVLYITVQCRTKPEYAPSLKEKVTWQLRLSSLKDILLPALLIVLVLGSIFFGIATPTEAAGVGAAGAFLICILLKKLSWKVMWESCRQTMSITGMVFWILIGATLFSVFYTSQGAQSLVTELISSLNINRWVILAFMQLILLVLGMFMDDYAVVTVCAPIFVPIAVVLGFDPIWFSIVFILNMQVAYLTPPFGWALIMMKGVAPPDISTRDIWRSVPPFVIMQLIVLIFVMIFPQLALWLPDKMM
ncbi:MAG: TRAP transporter large permease subunit [Deltaproteobacteria bacterium]|nr:TRAP transporter large permease subunit [Deltaproteobacteria bacterium]